MTMVLLKIFLKKVVIKMTFLKYLEQKGYPNILLNEILENYSNYTYYFRSKGKFQIAPKWELKILQKILKDYLYDNYSNKISAYSTAYIKNENISFNVSKHFGKNYFYVSDFSNFFPSIKLSYIQQYLTKSLMKEDESSLDVIFKIAFYKDSLQYGFPTSPILSNIIMFDFDNILFNNLTKSFPNNNISYSRYCDDITIASKYEIQSETTKKLITQIINSEYSFLQINKKKTKTFEKYSNYPYITGLVPLKNRATIGKKKFNLIKLNIYLHLKNKTIENDKLFKTKLSLSSYLSYIYLVDSHNYNRLKEHFSKNFTAKEINHLFKK